MSDSTLATASIAARLDRLPPSRYLYGLVAWISVGGFFELYDLFMTGYIAVGLIQAGIFKASTAGLLDLNGYASFVSAGFAGMFLGTLILSRFSDRYGRRITFTFSLIWYSIATLIMAFVTNPVLLEAWRFICGLGIGVQLVTISSYISEVSPKNLRGRFIAMSQFISFCAVPAVAAVSFLAIPHKFFGLDGWRYVTMIGSGGALFAVMLRSRLPESPRWLEAHGHEEAAEAAIREMERHAAAEAGGQLQPPELQENESALHRGAWTEIWSRAYFSRTFMLTVFNIFQAIGFYGFAAWVPVLLVSEGIDVTKSLTYVLVIALLNPFGSLLAMRHADAVQRKWQIVILALMIAACGMIWAQQRGAVGIMFFGSVITLANSWFSCALHTYQAELYPTRIRAQAVGFVYSWSRFSSIFANFLIARALHAYGVTGVFAIVASCMLIVAAVVAVLGPKSNRLALEALSG